MEMQYDFCEVRIKLLNIAYMNVRRQRSDTDMGGQGERQATSSLVIENSCFESKIAHAECLTYELKRNFIIKKVKLSL
jgi:hypothetical protein